jgi:DNA sulfur modification protein DndD
MILKRLTLENYCLFAGRHDFDLAPRTTQARSKPIVLFGGKNGAGKTTILGAIQLAFYGRRSVGVRVSDKDYHEILRSRVHRSKQTDKTASFAKVGVEFELVIQGERNDYYIERSWTSRDLVPCQEIFRVSKDGEQLKDVSREHLQTFISEIVPERLAQLFFFDGEKIKSIAEDITSNSAISEAIESLLGLDLVRSLQADLSTYRSRLLRDSNPAAYDKEAKALDDELAKMQREHAALKAEQDKQQDALAKIQHQIAASEERLSKRGGGYAEAKDANDARAANLEAKRTGLITQLRSDCDSALPFTLCPSITAKLCEELRLDQLVRSARLLDEELHSLKSDMLTAVGSHFPNGNSALVSQFVEQELTRYRNAKCQAVGSNEMHGLSEQAQARVMDYVLVQGPTTARRLLRNLSELATVELELRQARRDSEKAPEKSSLLDIFEELKAHNEELGMRKESSRRLSEQLQGVSNGVAALQRDKEKIEQRLATTKDVLQKVETIKKIDTALASYMSRLTKAKIVQLQSEVTECYNRLARKADFIKRVEIDPQTFSVSVIDKFGRSIPKEDLSSGEKQIFAISMLWGLARTSGRPLPVVIDTPLGRLDSDHRMNLVCNYFPHAGHQVILLSTDTEVDVGLFEKLRPGVSHCYHLKYDHEEASTSVETAYFWREQASA